MTNDRPLPASPTARVPCATRVEVELGALIVAATDVRAWVAHLRSHGWTDGELDHVWPTGSDAGI